MTLKNIIWPLLRPIVSVILAILAWIASVYFASLFTDASGRFLTDNGFYIAGPMLMILLLFIAYVLQLRWWESALPVVIPIWFVCKMGLLNYWGIRITLAFVLPFMISAISLLVCSVVKQRKTSNKLI